MNQDVIVFPRVLSKEDLNFNKEMFDLEMSEGDLKKITDLNRDLRFLKNIQDENFSFVPYWS